MERLPCSTATSLSRPIPVSTCRWGRGCRLPSAPLAREGEQGEAPHRITDRCEAQVAQRNEEGPKGPDRGTRCSIIPHPITNTDDDGMMALGPLSLLIEGGFHPHHHPLTLGTLPGPQHSLSGTELFGLRKRHVKAGRKS